MVVKLLGDEDVFLQKFGHLKKLPEHILLVFQIIFLLILEHLVSIGGEKLYLLLLSFIFPLVFQIF